MVPSSDSKAVPTLRNSKADEPPGHRIALGKEIQLYFNSDVSFIPPSVSGAQRSWNASGIDRTLQLPFLVAIERGVSEAFTVPGFLGTRVRLCHVCLAVFSFLGACSYVSTNESHRALILSLRLPTHPSEPTGLATSM